MKYVEPTSIEEALAFLGEEEDARCIAGGATLVAMMNADLVSPPRLVGLRLIDELEGINRTDDGIRIGAMTRHETIANSDMFENGLSVVTRAASQIAHPPIRRMGTIGGSISHADPAADFPCALVAANASVEICGADGRRVVPADDFFLGYYETATGENELVSAILLPNCPENTSGEHVKVARVDGDYATVAVSLVLGMENDTCTCARIAVGAVAGQPLHSDEADNKLLGSTLSENDINEAGAILAEAADPVNDVRGTADYRRRLIPRLLKRAVNNLSGRGVEH